MGLDSNVPPPPFAEPVDDDEPIDRPQLTWAEANQAIGKCIQHRASGDLATVLNVSATGAMLVQWDAGGRHWGDPASFSRRADLDGRHIEPRRRRWR